MRDQVLDELGRHYKGEESHVFRGLPVPSTERSISATRSDSRSLAPSPIVDARRPISSRYSQVTPAAYTETAAMRHDA